MKVFRGSLAQTTKIEEFTDLTLYKGHTGDLVIMSNGERLFQPDCHGFDLTVTKKQVFIPHGSKNHF